MEMSEEEESVQLRKLNHNLNSLKFGDSKKRTLPEGVG